MLLSIPTMDAVLVDFSDDGRVRLQGEDWCQPTLQESRAIIHAARQEMERLEDLIAAIDKTEVRKHEPGSGR